MTTPLMMIEVIVEPLTETASSLVKCFGFHFERMPAEFKVTAGSVIVYVCKHHKDIFVKNGRLSSLFDNDGSAITDAGKVVSQRIEKPS